MHPLKVSAEVLFEIEETLAEPLFMGVPIGSTLGSTYEINLYTGNGRWDKKSVWLDRIRYWHHYFRGIRQSQISTNIEQGRILFTLFNDSPRTRDLILPVIQKMDGKQCNLLGTSMELKSLPSGIQFLPVHSLALDMTKWRATYKKQKKIWHSKLKFILHKYQIPLFIFPHLAHAILTQSQIIVGYHDLLETIRPSGIVTVYDRYGRAAPLVLAAKARGIPTMTMMHGVINPPYGYTPLLADIAFCWGEQHRTQMVELGTESNRLVVTGCPRITPSLSANAEDVRHKLGLPLGLPVVMLATSPIALTSKIPLARVFCEALSTQKDISAVVRLHPSEKLEDYAELINVFPKIKFTSNKTMTLDEALAVTDVLVCHNSGMGSDALLKGKLTVILDAISEPLGHARELIESAGCPRAKSAEELIQIVNRITTEPKFKQKLQQQAEQYLSYQFAAFGDEAANNIAEEVRQRTLLGTNNRC